MFDSICLYFSLCWHLFVDAEWWAFLALGVVELFVGKGVYIALAVIIIPIILSLGIFYAIMRGMHRHFWCHGLVITFCGLCSLLTGATALLVYSADTVGSLLSGAVVKWADIMEENPALWVKDPTTLRNAFGQSVTPQGLRTTSANNASYAVLSLPSKAGESLGEANRGLFQANARALSIMAEDAFRTHFFLFQFITKLIELDTEDGEEEFVEQAILYWNGQQNDALSVGEATRSRAYSRERLAPIIHAVRDEACSAANTISWGLTINMLLLALLSLALGALAVFWDCDRKVRRQWNIRG